MTAFSGAKAHAAPAVEDPLDNIELPSVLQKTFAGYYHFIEPSTGDTLAMVVFNPIIIYPRERFRNKAEEKLYWKTVRDVKKTLPYAKLISSTLLETYEYIDTYQNEKQKQAYLKRFEKELFEQYKPQMKKMTKPMQVLYNRATCFDITMDNLPKACDILLDEHQFEIIRQKAVDRQDFLLEFDIRNHFFPGPMKYHNILAVIRGSKYPDEYVMMGGHLDAYDIATGSTDDGQGVCVTMEAARLLAAAGARPKRSIMFCIWTAEEYGLLGSKYFVENKTVPWDKISNYFNRDGGPLATVSVTVPPAMYDDFVEVCEPLKDYNPDIPFEVIKREGEPQARPTSAGGSDHAYFAMNGIPAISFREQDVFGYDFNYRDIWHTEDDLYDKLIPEYLEHSAVVQAVTAYGLANLNHLLSREGLYKD